MSISYHEFYYQVISIKEIINKCLIQLDIIMRLLKYRSETDHMSWRYLMLLLDNLDVKYNC